MNQNYRERMKEAELRRSGMQLVLDGILDARDSRQLLDAIMWTAMSFFNADAAAVFLYQHGSLRPATWVGLQPQLLGQESISPHGNLRAYMNRFMSPAHCRHFMASSLLCGDRSLGELVVCSTDQARAPYSTLDKELFSEMARRAAEALEPALAEREPGWQQGAIARITHVLKTESGLTAVARRAVDLARSELGADAAAVWLAAPVEDTLALLAVSDLPGDSVALIETLPFGDQNLASLAAASHQAQVAEADQPDGAQDLTSRLIERAGVRVMAALPLTAQGRLVGVFALGKKTPGLWTGDQWELMETASDLLASALLSARLLEEGDRQRLLSQSLTSTLTEINEQLAEANRRSTELTEVAQQKAAELEAMIANLGDAIFVCDLAGRIVLINDAGLEMIGVERAAELRTLQDYLSAARVRYPTGNPIPAEELAITRALKGETVRGTQETLYDTLGDKDRYVIVSAAPIRDRKGRLIGAVQSFSDISRLKELDLLKDQFVTVAAHEIRTPVTAIKGFAQTLSRTIPATEPRTRAALETIVRMSDRIDALVRDFLELSRMRQGLIRLDRERAELAGLVSSTIARVANTTVRHEFVISKAEEVWVEGEVERLQEVIRNLLDNAVRYSPEGGRIEVRVERKIDRATVSVKDEGLGIPESRQPNVFERFYRAHIGTSSDYGGLGIGLYMSREVIRQHGGEMGFQSKEGVGSTFYFSLPLAG